MPRSSKSHRHHKQTIPTHLPHTKKKSSAIPVFLIFLGALGAGIAFFAVGANSKWLLIGAGIGAVVGILIGRAVDRQGKDKEER